MLGLIGLLGPAAARAEEFFTYTGEPVYQAPLEVFREPAALGAVTGRLRVASYNIEHFSDGVEDEAERTPALALAQAQGAARLIDQINPDLLVVQEIEGRDSVRLLNAQLTRPFGQAVVTQLGEMTQYADKLNLAVLAQVPLLSARELDFGLLTGPGRPTRGLLRVAVDLGGEHRLLVYVLHLKSNFGNAPRNIAQREAALNLMVKDVEAVRAQQPDLQWEVLALGDTNVDPELAQFAADTSFRPLADWADLWRGRPLAERITIPTRVGDPAKEFPPAAFDRIFASRALTQPPWVAGSPGVLQQGCATNDCNLLPGVNGHLSDHYPVFVDLTR